MFRLFGFIRRSLAVGVNQDLNSVFTNLPISDDASWLRIFGAMMCGSSLNCVIYTFCVLFAVFTCEILAKEDDELVCHQKGDDCVLKSELLRTAEAAAKGNVKK